MLASLTLTLTGIALLTAAAGTWAAARVAQRRSLGQAAAAAFVPLVVIAVGGTLFATRLGLSAYGVVHLLYLLVTVAVPLIAIGLLSIRWAAAAPIPGRRGCLVVALVCLLPAPIGFWATHIEPGRLRTDYFEHDVATIDRSTGPIRVAVLSDLQTPSVGSHEREAVDRVLGSDPDIIVLTGDLYQGPDDELAAVEEDFRRLLARLDAPGGVYAVEGDSDRDGRHRRLTEGTGIRVLDDEIITTTVRGTPVRIGGSRLDYSSPESLAMQVALVESDERVTTLLLGHRPDIVADYPPGLSPDLVIAGHTHGGQVVIPGYGPIVTLSKLPRDIAAGGLHEWFGNPILVSRGVGLVRDQAPQVRLFSPPQIVVVDLV